MSPADGGAGMNARDRVAEFLQWQEERGRETRHARYSLPIFMRFLKKSRRTILTATVDDLEAFRGWVKRTYRGEKEQQARIRYVFHFFGFLVLKRVRDDNPARRIITLGFKPWSEREAAKVRLAPNLRKRYGIRYRAIIEMVMCGLLPEQARTLDLDHVAPDFSEIRTPDFRVVLSAAAGRFLRRYVEEVRPLVERDSKMRALFLSDKRGKRMTRAHLSNMHDEISKVTGLPKGAGMLRRLVR